MPSALADSLVNSDTSALKYRYIYFKHMSMSSMALDLLTSPNGVNKT